MGVQYLYMHIGYLFSKTRHAQTKKGVTRADYLSYILNSTLQELYTRFLRNFEILYELSFGPNVI